MNFINQGLDQIGNAMNQAMANPKGLVNEIGKIYSPYVPTSFDLQNQMLLKLPKQLVAYPGDSPEDIDQNSPLDPEGKEVAKNIANHLSKSLQIWMDSGSFEFVLPTTSFYLEMPPVSYQPLPPYVPPRRQFQSDLTQAQLKDIYNTGQFQMEFQQKPLIPEVWEFNERCFMGRERVNRRYDITMSIAFNHLLEIKERFKMSDQRDRDDFKEIEQILDTRYSKQRAYISDGVVCCSCDFDIVSGLQSIKYFIPKLINLLFGLPILVEASEELMLSYIYSEHVHDMSQNYNVRRDFYNFMKTVQKEVVPEGQPSQMALLREAQKLFEKEWCVKQDQLLRQYSTLTQRDFFFHVRDEKMKMLQIFIENNPKILRNDQSVKENLIHIIRITEYIDWTYKCMKDDLFALQEKYLAQIMAENNIRGQVMFWIQQTVVSRMAREANLLKQNYDRMIESFLGHYKVFGDYLHTYQEAVKLKTNFKSERERYEQRFYKTNKTPMRTFTFYKYCYLPYQVEKDPYSNEFHTITYQQYKVDTVKTLWRTKLWCIRFYVWASNTMRYFWMMATRSKVGIFMICACAPVVYDQTCDPKTGALIGTKMNNPVMVIFKDVLRGISKSRKDFEDAEDDGFFGQSFSRLWNILECFIFRYSKGKKQIFNKKKQFLFFSFFRLIVVGIFIDLFAYPIVIILFTAIFLMLAIMSWVIVLFIMVIRIIIGIFFYDFDDPCHGISQFQYLKLQNKYLTSQCLPLIILFLELFVRGFGQIIISILFAFFLHPLLAGMIAAWAIIHWAYTSCTDQCMYCCIQCEGRQPYSDSCMVSQVRGGGMGRQYMATIDLADLQIFIVAQLELQMLEEYRKRLLRMINKPVSDAQVALKQFFEPLHVTVKVPEQITDSRNKLQKTLERMVKQRIAQLPALPKTFIRFTQNELYTNFPLTLEMVKRLVIMRNMDYIWDNMKVQRGEFTMLTRALWMQVFGTEDIFEPVETIESRFKLEKACQNDFIGSVISAWQGEANMKIYRPEFSPNTSNSYVVDELKFNDIQTIIGKSNVSVSTLIDQLANLSQIFNIKLSQL